MKNNLDILYQHLGGRGGKYPINIPKELRDAVSFLTFDADEDCIEDIALNEALCGFKTVNILPYCVSDSPSKTLFNLNCQPQTSSLLDWNPAFNDFVRVSEKFGNMRLKEITKLRKQVEVTTDTLENILKKEDLPAPDFISMDIQGLEYELLESSQDLFAKDVLYVNTEVAFVEMYKGQKLFSDVDSLLRRLGFTLCELQLYDAHHSDILPAFLEGKGFPFDGEAFYLKNVCLEKASVDVIIKYCFACVLSGQMHMLLKTFLYIAEKRKDVVEVMDSVASYSYVSMLRHLFEAYVQSESIQLPFFHHMETYKSYFPENREDIKGLSTPIDVHKAEERQVFFSKIFEDYGLHDLSSLLKKNLEKNINIYERIKASGEIPH